MLQERNWGDDVGWTSQSQLCRVKAPRFRCLGCDKIVAGSTARIMHLCRSSAVIRGLPSFVYPEHSSIELHQIERDFIAC